MMEVRIDCNHKPNYVKIEDQAGSGKIYTDAHNNLVIESDADGLAGRKSETIFNATEWRAYQVIR
jgi:hypothetical protein